MFAKGYHALPVRTGYEQVVAQRVDDMFATCAKEDGKVLEVTPSSIVVEYKSGEKKAVQLGRRFGTVAGTTFPHELATHFKAGDKVKAGDCLAYNTNYFERDPHNPTQVVMKFGMLVKTAIMESPDTLEDSSVISEDVAKQLGTNITQIRDIVVTFDQTIHNLIKVGQETESDDILCTIEDSVTANPGLFDKDSIDTLRLLGSQAPRAKYRGRVEKIEVFYNGDKEDMSPSLRAIADAGDRDRAKLAKSLGKKNILTGYVDDSLRIGGNPLNLDSMAIRVYITVDAAAGVGDKGVFANQMKTIFGRVMSGVNETKSGEKLGAIFSYQSISNRIVNSCEIIGTTSTLLRVLQREMVKIYRGSK